jgi:hypothetical protein
MTPRKKRSRYREAARKHAAWEGTEFDENDWDRIWELLDRYGEPTYLYAIVDYESRLVKIGKSKSPGSRLKALKTGNGSDLKIWAYCEERPFFTERELHARLADFRVSGEWFHLVPAVQTVIDEMRGEWVK